MKLSVTTHSKRLGLDATFWGTYDSRQVFAERTNTGGNIDDTSMVYAPHRTTLNLNLTKNIGGADLFLRMENLLNETDAFYRYGPGFQIFAGLKYSLDLHA